MNETDLVWRNSHNTNSEVIVIYYIMSKDSNYILKTSTYSASMVKEW